MFMIRWDVVVWVSEVRCGKRVSFVIVGSKERGFYFEFWLVVWCLI